MLKFILATCLTLCFAALASAQSVRVDSAESGQGFMVKDNGICWVLMPRHLLPEGEGGSPNLARFEVETSPAPSVRGRGRGYTDFWEGMDFAIGSGGQAAGDTACTVPLDTIYQTRATAGEVLRGELRFVQPGGAIRQFPMTILDSADHKTFLAEFADPTQNVFKGFSGAFLFAGDLPLGMAIKSPKDSNQLTFIRIEELAFATQRWLAGRARAVQIIDTPQTQAAEGAHSLRLVDYQTPPLSDETGPENLATGNGAYHFDFTGPTSITFALGEGDAAVGVSRVRVISEGDGAKPLRIRIQTVVSKDGAGSPFRFKNGEMPPTGDFDTGRIAERRANQVIINVDTVQGSGPIRIDRIEVY